MNYLVITKGMFRDGKYDLTECRRFYEFFLGDDKEEIDDLMYYCKEGEEVEISGFVCGSSHYMETKKLYPGDIIHNFGKDKYRLIKAEYADLFRDSLKCDEYEQLLDTIYQSGQLRGHIDELYTKVMIEGN